MRYRKLPATNILLTTALAFTSASKNKHKRVILSKKTFLFLLLISSCLSAFPQYYQWDRGLKGTHYNQAKHGLAITADAAGNVYTAGYFKDTIDFDPGSGVVHIAAATGNQDIFITKFDAGGKFIWTKAMAGSSWAIVNCIAVDGAGNVFTTGFFIDSVDFDPGSGTTILNAGKGQNLFVSKLDSYGNFIWAKELGDTMPVFGQSLATDNSGNVFITGGFRGTLDFNPGAGVSKLTAKGAYDIFILRLTPNGNFAWATNFSGSSLYGNDIATDASGNVYITGGFYGTVDFDPGAGISNLTAYRDNDIFVVKLTGTGSYIWAKGFQGSGFENANSIAVDPSGNVYATGNFQDTLDFDPGIATYKITAIGNSDAFIFKLNSSGALLWAKVIRGTQNEVSEYLGVDKNGSVCILGWYTGTVDFDPGPGTYFMTSMLQIPNFICMLNDDGDFLWAHDLWDANPGYGSPLAVDPAGNIYMTGTLGNGDLDFDQSTYKAIGSGGDIFVVKYAGCKVIAAASPSTTACAGSPITLKASGASTYTWTGLPAGSTTFIPVSNKTYKVSGTDSNGCVSSDSVSIHMVPIPVVGLIFSQPSDCGGTPVTLSGTGASTYSWSNGVQDGTAFKPLTSKTYKVTGIDSNGCKGSDSVTVVVKPAPVVGIIASQSSVCEGTPVTLSGTGASTYAWSGGINDSVPFVPGSTGKYTVTGTAPNGCEGSDSITIEVKPLPIVGIIVSQSPVCAGSPVTLSGTGASTYAWSGGISDNVAFIPASTTKYDVTGTAANGCKNSADVTVTVTPLPVIITHPADQTVTVNSNAVFNTSAAGTGISYQWQENSGGTFTDLSNNASYSGVTSKILIVSSVSMTMNNYRYRCIITEGNCSDASSDALLTVNNTTGIQHIIHENTHTVYPNPANESFTLFSSASTPVSYSITDARGRHLLSGETRGSETLIDISSLAEGIYFLRVDQRTVKVVKE